MPRPVSRYFDAPCGIPVSVRLVEGDGELLNEVRGRLAAKGLPSTRGEVLRAAIREGLEVLQKRLARLEAR